MIHHEARTRDNVEITLHDARVLRRRVARWEYLSPNARMHAARMCPAAHLDSWTAKNVTTEAFHEAVIQQLDPFANHVIPSATHLAVGDDDTTPSTGDTDLGGEVHRTNVTEHAVSGREIQTTTFLDQGQAEDETILEAGLVAGDLDGGDILINRVLVDDPEGRLDPKPQEVAVTFHILISMEDVSE